MAQVRIRKRGKTFSYIFEAGKVDGKRKVVEKGGYPTKAAAYKAGVEAYNDFLHGNIGITSESITLKEFMTAWLDNVVALNVKPTTLQVYRAWFKNRIEKQIGNVKVQALTPALLDKWQRELQRSGLSRNTLQASCALLSNALKYAVYPAQIISSNPVSFIKVPKSAPKKVIKRHIITPEQFHKALEQYPFGAAYHMPLIILYHTGIRIGELLGLTWQDIDFENKRIKIRRQMTYLQRRGFYLSTLKTESSKRDVLIDKRLIAELERWRARQQENQKEFGDGYVCVYRLASGKVIKQSESLPAPVGEKISLVCTREDGRLILRSNLSAAFQKLGLNSHSFRHTHATFLIENGVIPQAVAERLGHADATITQKIYAHNTAKLQEDLMKIYEQSLQTNL